MTLDPPVELSDLNLPDFGNSGPEPAIPRETYLARVAQALARAGEQGFDALVIYGDREHSANIAFLTGYDPRFEEALLVLLPGQTPALLVGNEGWAYAELAEGTFERVLFQSLSLPGQPRDRNPGLPAILRDLGLGPGQRIGVAGWKYFGDGDAGLDEAALEIPSYMADCLRNLAGERGVVLNAGALFMDPGHGMRAINDADQLAVFEFAATHTSQGLRNLLTGLRAGMSEYEAARMIGMTGMPLSAHLMLSSGERAFAGLPSPSARVISRGDPFTVAYGVQGALNARAGFVVAEAAELPEGIRDYVDRLVAPYFSAAVAWYETLGLGVTGGELWQAVHSRIGAPFFGLGLNPGHLIHLDEWLHSPVYEGSTIPLASGMALQCDIIPATHSPWFTTNIEDGIALADAGLRAEMAAKYPEAWARIQARRAYMGEVLSIRLRPEVLPFSNIPAWLPPFLLATGKAMRVVRKG